MSTGGSGSGAFSAGASSVRTGITCVFSASTASEALVVVSLFEPAFGSSSWSKMDRP